MDRNILLKNVSFKYERMLKPIFHELNLSINENWKLGLLGKNGSGKTTFLNLLRKKLDFSGTIETPLEFKYFPNHPDYAENELTIDMLLRRTPSVESWEIEKELNFLELPYELLYQPFPSLSGGEQAKILLLELFLDKTTFPLIDEPTNNLDFHGRNLVADYLNKQTGYIVISHDEAFLNQFVDHVLSINKNTIDIIAGDVNTWRTELENSNNYTIEKNNQLKKEITRLKDSSQRISNWGDKRENFTNDASSRRLAAKQMKKSKAVQKRRENKIEEKSLLIDNVTTTAELEMHVNIPRKKLIALRNFQILRNSQPLFKPINLDLLPEERLFLRGDNGVGKSTLLSFILNPTKYETSGEYNIHLPSEISYLQQKSIAKKDYFSYFDSLDKEQKEVLWRILSELDLPSSKFHNFSTQQWSEGELKKISIAKNIFAPSELYIWDEVTNYLDIDVIYQLIAALNKNMPTMLAVDHNDKFVQDVATRTLTLEKL